jgi:hypothetical protein
MIFKAIVQFSAVSPYYYLIQFDSGAVILNLTKKE